MWNEVRISGESGGDTRIMIETLIDRHDRLEDKIKDASNHSDQSNSLKLVIRKSEVKPTYKTTKKFDDILYLRNNSKLKNMKSLQ